MWYAGSKADGEYCSIGLSRDEVIGNEIVIRLMQQATSDLEAIKQEVAVYGAPVREEDVNDALYVACIETDFVNEEIPMKYRMLKFPNNGDVVNLVLSFIDVVPLVWRVELCRPIWSLTLEILWLRKHRFHIFTLFFWQVVDPTIRRYHLRHRFNSSYSALLRK